MVIIMLLSLLVFGGNGAEENTIIEYFIKNRTEYGILDRDDNRNIISVACTGMGATCLAIAVEQHKFSEKELIEWINTVLNNQIRINKHNHGWFFHFIDTRGNPVYDQEVSSIDTALYLLGMRQAAIILQSPSLLHKINELIGKVDVPWMLTNAGSQLDKKYFAHGWYWIDNKPIFIKYNWDEYSEGILLYKLFRIDYAPTKMAYNLPLFCYFYPKCYYTDKVIEENLRKAIEYQKKTYGMVGFTSCHGAEGYIIMNPEYISPLAIHTLMISSPLHFRNKLASSYNLRTKQENGVKIGIDFASCYILRNKK